MTDSRSTDAPSATPPERRQAPRIPFPAEVVYKRSGLRLARAVDLNDGGMCLLAPEPIEGGWVLDLYVHRRSIHLTGTVVYVRQLEREQHRIGVRFPRRDGALAAALAVSAQALGA